MSSATFTFRVDRRLEYTAPQTPRARELMRLFGLDARRLREAAHCCGCEIVLSRGQVCYITGASGAGKSFLLGEMYRQCDPARRLRLTDIPLETDRPLIDCIEGDTLDAMRTLARAGLSDAIDALNRPASLSEGQKYRYRLARALVSERDMIFADEFCSGLDRITAAVIAHKIACAAPRGGKIFVLASSHEDILADLAPDVLVVKYLNRRTDVITREGSRIFSPGGAEIKKKFPGDFKVLRGGQTGIIRDTMSAAHGKAKT